MTHKNNKVIRILSVLLVSYALLSCSNNEQEPEKLSASKLIQPESATSTIDTADTKAAITNAETSAPLTMFYLKLAQPPFSSTCSSVEQLQQAVSQFVTQPSEKGLSDIKAKWLTSHQHYASTQIFRNINIKHPLLDQSKTDPVQHSLAIKIDQTPILPGYIDEIEGYPKSGYIFSTLAIDRETLNQEHQFADSAYVAMGFHLIEFLLWGEGNRSHKGFAARPAEAQETNNDSLAPSNVRRSELLTTTTSMLAEDLNTLCTEWNIDTGFYATTLKSMAPEEQVAAINAATEQLISNLQLATAKVRQATDNNEEPVEVALHSEFSNSDKADIQIQRDMLKALINSKEWQEEATKQEHTQKLTELAKALLL